MIRATILVASVLALAHLSLACVETGVPCGCDARDYGAAKDTCAWQKLSKALPPRKGGVIFYADYLTAPMCCTLTVKQQKVCCKAKPGVSMDVAQYQMLAQYRMIKACSTPDTPLVLNELQKQILDISSKVSEMCDAVLESILKIIPDALRDIQVLAVRLHKIFDIMNELIDFISQSNCVLLFGSKTNVKFLGEEDPNKVAYSQTPEESGGGNHLISQYYGKAFTNPIDIMVPHNLFSHNNDLNAIINSLVSGFLKKYKGTNVKSSQKVPLQNALRVLTLMSTFDYLNAMIMTKDPSQIIKDPKGTRVVKATGIKEYDDFLGELTKVVDLRLA